MSISVDIFGSTNSGYIWKNRRIIVYKSFGKTISRLFRKPDLSSPYTKKAHNHQ